MRNGDLLLLSTIEWDDRDNCKHEEDTPSATNSAEAPIPRRPGPLFRRIADASNSNP